jgi:hypothetical protein
MFWDKWKTINLRFQILTWAINLAKGDADYNGDQEQIDSNIEKHYKFMLKLITNQQD